MTRSIKGLSFGLLFLFFMSVSGCGDSFFEEPDFSGRSDRVKRSVSIKDRIGCGGEEPPQGRFDSSENLRRFRDVLRSEDVSAFVIPSGDSHQSEYIAPADKRRQWISGFTGSAGLAAVTMDKAAMWADGRYTIQAQAELDCNWLYIKGEEHDDVTFTEWLGNELSPGSKVGADPSLTGAFTWLKWKDELEAAGLVLVPLFVNPIDKIWEQRPQRSTEPLEIIGTEFAGQTWQDKLSDLRSTLQSKDYDAFIITALDELAWLYNLRGKDIPYNPVFRGYSVVTDDRAILYLPVEKQSEDVKRHLNARDCSGGRDCVEIRDYLDILGDLETFSAEWQRILLGKKWAYTGGASFAIYGLLPEDKVVFDLSPVMLTKGRKNKAEIRGMLNANIRDAVALMEMASILEEDIPNGEEWNEIQVSNRIRQLRAEQKNNKGESFETISAYGPNGAVIHYKPKEKTAAKIGTDSLLLLDSGGQYLDGTTDVTRTFHFGEPTPFQIEAYTRVLMGSIDLARSVFKAGTPDTRMDILTRFPLYQVGLNYEHGTGHGIGAYGFIHESPIQVRIYAKEDHPFEVGQFFSDEPGYYQPYDFGIRLETVLRVVEKKGLRHQDKHDYGTFLGFDAVCLVPFEPKLIDYKLLNAEQINWLNEYNRLIREKVGPELQKQGKQKAQDWMMKRTKPVGI